MNTYERSEIFGRRTRFALIVDLLLYCAILWTAVDFLLRQSPFAAPVATLWTAAAAIVICLLLQRRASQGKKRLRERVKTDLLLERLLTELHTLWTARLNEPGVTWKLRRMKTLWGVCHFSKRQITYARQLALKPRELVEYVVVHELTHLKVHNHGAAFKALMDARLPNWRQLRRRLNARAATGSDADL